MATKASYWSNQDGLCVGFGARKREANTGGNIGGASAERTFVMQIHGAELNDDVAACELETSGRIPSGAYIKEATLVVEQTFAGATATLDIGVYDASDDSVVDDAGIDAAIAVASLTAGAVIACDGADIGTVTAQESKLGASYDTAAFTAGRATLTVVYTVPNSPA